MKDNTLFSRITVVTPDGSGRTVTLPATWVSVKNGTVAYVGDSESAARSFFDGEQFEFYDGRGKIMLPAMANTHGHIAMTLLRNQADDSNLHDWLFNVIFPRETRLNPDNVRTGTLLGLAEMIRSGTGAAADMYYHGESVAMAALEAGFRVNICFEGKIPGPDNRPLVRPDLLSSQIDEYHRHSSGLLQVSLLVHSVYLYDPSLYPELSAMALSLNCPVQVHVSETRREVEECLHQYGCRPPRQLEKFGFFQTPTIAAHCVWLDDDDRRILASHPVVVAHNPSSNLKLGSGMADLPSMLQAGVRVALGSDGAASNNNLDLYREMRLASFLAKGNSGDAAIVPAPLLLDMATRQGMAGLGFAGSGQIAAGFAGDLQIVDTDRPSMTPLGDAASALVYSADAGCVESLMVDGRWLMRKHELKTIDEERLLHDARCEAAALNGN